MKIPIRAMDSASGWKEPIDVIRDIFLDIKFK